MQRHLFRVGDEGGDLVQLTPPFASGDADFRIFALSPDRQTVAYTVVDSVAQTEDLFVVSASGGTSTAVSSPSPSGTQIFQIVWAPDSSKLAYVANPQGDSPPGFPIAEVFVAERDGSNSQVVSGDVGSPVSATFSNPRWSPNSQLLAFGVIGLEPRIGQIGIDIHDTQVASPNSFRVTPSPGVGGGRGVIAIEYAWLSDSSGVVYRSDLDRDFQFQLYIAHVGGSPTIRVNPDITEDEDVTDFSVSPDGSSIAYSMSNDPSSFDIYVSDVDGSNDRQINPEPVGDSMYLSSEFSWSPDSSTIAYLHDLVSPLVLEAYVSSADGSGTTKLHEDLSAPGAYFLRWAPSGEYLAFIAELDEPDRAHVYVVESNGMNLTNVSSVVAPGGVTAPIRWSPNSDQIAFLAMDVAQSRLELFAATRDGLAGSRVNADLPDDLEVANTFLWSSDGSRIMFGDKPADMNIIDGVTLWVGNPSGDPPLELNGTNDFLGFFVY